MSLHLSCIRKVLMRYTRLIEMHNKSILALTSFVLSVGGWFLVVSFELAVASLRSAYWPTDTDVFQELERDLSVRKRFEEASAVELQLGWDRGKKKDSAEIETERIKQEQREGAVEELLMNRPDGLEGATKPTPKQVRVSIERLSSDVQERLSRRFPSVKSSTG
jgi:phospholipid-translocating ATPase